MRPPSIYARSPTEFAILVEPHGVDDFAARVTCTLARGDDSAPARSWGVLHATEVARGLYGMASDPPDVSLSELVARATWDEVGVVVIAASARIDLAARRPIRQRELALLGDVSQAYVSQLVRRGVLRAGRAGILASSATKWLAERAYKRLDK